MHYSSHLYLSSFVFNAFFYISVSHRFKVLKDRQEEERSWKKTLVRNDQCTADVWFGCVLSALFLIISLYKNFKLASSLSSYFLLQFVFIWYVFSFTYTQKTCAVCLTVPFYRAQYLKSFMHFHLLLPSVFFNSLSKILNVPCHIDMEANMEFSGKKFRKFESFALNTNLHI